MGKPISTQGRRVPYGTPDDDYQPGDYGLNSLGFTGRVPLNGDEGHILIECPRWHRVHHDDGTITIKTPIRATNGIAHWSGRLIRGVWIEDEC